MEINEDLKNYILCFDDVLPKEILHNFYRTCKESDKFIEAKITTGTSQKVDPRVRKTLTWHPHNLGTESFSEVHWVNFLNYTFKKTFKKYQQQINIAHANITDIQILKYEEGGFYNFHVDDGSQTPRTLSFIYFVNDEYEGGELVFNFNNSSKDLVMEKKKNRMIIWPSNFLYKHAVKPTKNGTRYSVVAWAR